MRRRAILFGLFGLDSLASLAWMGAIAGCHDTADKTASPAATAAATPSVVTSAPPSDAPKAPEIAATAVLPDGMARIPAAFVLIGSRYGSGNPEELPMHEAVIASFDLDKTEVTMDAYASCVTAGSCKAPRDSHPFCNVKFADRGNHPVNCVDWNDAVAYCAFAKKRLPTESEWEYAAKGGDEHQRFSWGNEDPDQHRACYDHPGGSCPVAAFAPGAFGLFDMSGNVWEWTSSVFAPYPEGAASGAHRVYRGGSWSRRFPKWLRNQNRNRYRPEEWSAALGIRCAHTALPLVCPEDAAPASEDRCARSKGDPRCEAGYSWNGKACTVGGGTLVGAGPVPASGVVAASDSHRIENVAEPAPGDAITKTRTPSFDSDCNAHYPGTPAAYNFVGGGFWDRVPIMTASRCVRRDIGTKWTSGCCPS